MGKKREKRTKQIRGSDLPSEHSKLEALKIASSRLRAR